MTHTVAIDHQPLSGAVRSSNHRMRRRGMNVELSIQARQLMTNYLVPRETLYARFDEIAKGRAQGDSWAAHEAVLDRLAMNRREAEANGWTECALERVGGSGRLRLWGIRPSR